MKLTERKVKWGCIVLLLLVLCFTVFGAIDIERFWEGKKPIFIIHKDNFDDGGTTIYYGIGYQLISWRQIGTKEEDISEDISGDFVGKECHIFFYRDVDDGPSAGVPLVFEEWNK